MMRMSLVFLLSLALGCTTGPTDVIDGGVSDVPRGFDVLCPPIQTGISCRSTEPGACTPVRARGFDLPNGCAGYGCPGSSVQGSCSCEEARNCVLDFVGCCGHCDAEPEWFSSPDFVAAHRAEACRNEECACDLERVAPYDQQVPLCVENLCEVRVIERTCTSDEECTLVHIPNGDDACAQLDAISVSSEADFIAYHAESTSCEVAADAMARCDDTLGCVVDTPE